MYDPAGMADSSGIHHTQASPSASVATCGTPLDATPIFHAAEAFAAARVTVIYALALLVAGIFRSVVQDE